MKNSNSSPEWQARTDWREEGTFRTEPLEHNAAQRYRQEARRIEREWSDIQYGGPRHVV